MGDHEGGGERAAIFGRDGEGAMHEGGSERKSDPTCWYARSYVLCDWHGARGKRDPRGAVRAQSTRRGGGAGSTPKWKVGQFVHFRE